MQYHNDPTHMLNGDMPVTLVGTRIVIRDGITFNEVWVDFGFGRGHAWIDANALRPIK